MMECSSPPIEVEQHETPLRKRIGIGLAGLLLMGIPALLLFSRPQAEQHAVPGRFISFNPALPRGRAAGFRPVNKRGVSQPAVVFKGTPHLTAVRQPPPAMRDPQPSPAVSSVGGSSWRISLNFGREPGSSMPADWAASGARLAFSLDIKFDTAECDQAIQPVKEPLLDRTVLRLEPLSQPSFVGASGEEAVVLGSGGWSQTSGVSPFRRYAVDSGASIDQFALRFFLDLPDGARRNDVVLGTERIFFTDLYGWSPGALAATEAAVVDVEKKIEALDKEIEKAQKQGPVRRALSFRRFVRLTERRSFVRGKLREAKAALPADGETVEGPGGVLLGAKGGRLSVKRPGRFGVGEVYVIVGRFTISELK